MATSKKKTTKKAPKTEEKTTLMGLLKKGLEFNKKIFKSWKDFLLVGDVCSYVVGIMGLWLVYAGVMNIF
tara:strand:+ start:3892 stop:4101 length:210 start_codon:yes stop_codon:yes gene_type:complete